jgi:uncharacterized protein (TIGR02246 family)
MTGADLAAEEQLAIQQLYARQSHAIDSGDARGWAACFTSDGAFRSPTYGAPVVGTEALTAFAEDFAQAATQAGVVRRHWTTALAIETETETYDSVAARCYAMVLATAAGERPVIERTVVFHDRLVRRNGRWLIEERRVSVDGRAA